MMKSIHERKYVPGATALVMGRLRNDLILMPQDSIETLIIKSNFLNKAPFLWVHLSYRYGIKNNFKVEFQRIDRKYGDLPIAIELDMEILQWADQNNLGLLHDIFMIGALEALIQVGDKYKLLVEVFKEERKKYGNIPDTIEECAKYPQMSTAELRSKYGIKDLEVNRCTSCGSIKLTPEARQCLKCGVFADPMLE